MSNTPAFLVLTATAGWHSAIQWHLEEEFGQTRMLYADAPSDWAAGVKQLRPEVAIIELTVFDDYHVDGLCCDLTRVVSEHKLQDSPTLLIAVGGAPPPSDRDLRLKWLICSGFACYCWHLTQWKDLVRRLSSWVQESSQRRDSFGDYDDSIEGLIEARMPWQKAIKQPQFNPSTFGTY